MTKEKREDELLDEITRLHLENHGLVITILNQKQAIEVLSEALELLRRDCYPVIHANPNVSGMCELALAQAREILK